MSNLPSTGQSRFAKVPSAEIQRSSFDRSHGLKTAFQEAQLVPIFVDEALPGDTFNLQMTGFCRLATPIFPVMDNIYLDTFFFFVPYRLVWDNFQRFMGEEISPGASTDFLVPQWGKDTNQFIEGGLGDYFGIPTKVNDTVVSALPLRAYQLIWNEWFRDQNLQDPITIEKGDGATESASQQLAIRNKRHDYFTSALPWPQKGPGALIPISGRAPVEGLGVATGGTTSTFSGDLTETGPQTRNYPFSRSTAAASPSLITELTAASGAFPAIYANLERTLEGGTINMLRQAFAIQRLLERDARGGTRYTELIRAHFGVTSPDARLQRPEYLGGGSTPINIATVHNSVADGVSPLGRLAGIGTSTPRNGFTKSFTEHGVIIGLANVRSDMTYQQGVNRMWSRRTKYDFFWPALANIGEQAILRKEIYMEPVRADQEIVFGYQERYGEYRYKPSYVTGRMRSNATLSLDPWHLAYDFSAAPVLNDSFIREAPPMSRVVAVPSEPRFIFDGYFQLNCARPMPMFGIPGLSDHF